MCCGRRLQKSTKTPYFESSRSFKVIDFEKTDKLVTSACYDRKHVHAYLQPFSHETSQQQLNNNFYEGTGLWCPRAQVSLNPENLNLEHQNLRSMLKISYTAYTCLSQLISVQFALEICVAARNCQKVHKNPIWRSRSSKVLDFGANQEPVTTSY